MHLNLIHLWHFSFVMIFRKSSGFNTFWTKQKVYIKLWWSPLTNFFFLHIFEHIRFIATGQNQKVPWLSTNRRYHYFLCNCNTQRHSDTQTGHFHNLLYKTAGRESNTMEMYHTKRISIAKWEPKKSSTSWTTDKKKAFDKKTIDTMAGGQNACSDCFT